MKTLIAIAIFYWVNIVAASIALSDYIYDLQATLTSNAVITIDQEPHFYEMFYIYTDGEATLTFDNYDANLISPYNNGEYSDPYLYLYIVDNFTFPSLNAFSKSYVLLTEDDDGNEDIGEGLYFYLSDITFTNEIVAMVTSYDPMTTGTVDFNVYSDNELTVVPEPVAVGLALVGGTTLFLARKKYG
jgi:hypothetical protein